jgi:hypothetical protein
MLCATLAGALSLTLALAAMAGAALAEGPLVAATPFAHVLRAATPDAHKPTCTGTAEAPGVLTGRYTGNVTVEGECVVNAGQAVVDGNLTISEGSTLLAAFGLNDVKHSGNSSLTVHGSVRVRPGASLLLGCEPQHFSCIDDPEPEPGTLSSKDHIYGSLIEQGPLGVVVHNSEVNGNVLESGGGGGVNCNPQGIFEFFPMYSDYEDMTVGGRLMVKDLESCWLGIARVHVGGKLDLLGDQLADPDAIEVIANRVDGNLNCREDSQVWDSADGGEELFPRVAEPNTVAGKRFGQCVLASPETEGGPLGPGPF